MAINQMAKPPRCDAAAADCFSVQFFLLQVDSHARIAMVVHSSASWLE